MKIIFTHLLREKFYYYILGCNFILISISRLLIIQINYKSSLYLGDKSLIHLKLEIDCHHHIPPSTHLLTLREDMYIYVIKLVVLRERNADTLESRWQRFIRLILWYEYNPYQLMWQREVSRQSLRGQIYWSWRDAL